MEATERPFVSPFFSGNQIRLYSQERAMELIHMEQSALKLCGGMVGDCYMLGEALDSIMVDVMSVFSKRAWFRMGTKKLFRDAKRKMGDELRMIRANSLSTKEYIYELSDYAYDYVKTEYMKMHNGSMVELGKRGYKDAEELSHMFCVGIIFSYIGSLYELTMKQMDAVFHTNYEKFYGQMRFKIPNDMWRNAVTAYYDKYHNGQHLETSSIKSLNSGIVAFGRKFTKFIKDEDICRDLEERFTEDKTKSIITDALKDLGITKKETA